MLLNVTALYQTTSNLSKHYVTVTQKLGDKLPNMPNDEIPLSSTGMRKFKS